MKKTIIAPSVLACDYGNAGNEVNKVYKAGAEYLHLDVMDGIFVPNISFGPDFIASLRKHSDAVFDTHLMITKPERYLEKFAACSDIITIHYEATENPSEVLKEIRKLGKKAGVSIKPKTPVSVLEDILKNGLCDMVLIMSVEPGFGGQKFMPESLEKIAETKKLIDKYCPETDIEVDGGINTDNVKKVIEAGANVIVAGSAVFRAEDAEKAVRMLLGKND